MTIKPDGAIFQLTSLENLPTSAPIISQVTFLSFRSQHTPHFFCFRAGIAASNTSHVQYFDGEDRREKYDDFYEQVVRVKNIGICPFADTAQKLLVSYPREDLEQPRAGTWYEDTWTGENGRYSLAHAGYAGSNNNMGQEID